MELDQIRFDALENGELSDADAPFIFRRLRRIYEKAAKTQGAEVGEEMIGAAEAADEIGVPHFFIDVEATPVVSGILKDLTVGQKMKLVGSVLGASILPQKTLETGIQQIGEDPDTYMEQFGKAFPQLKKDIVDYRDRYMAKKILELSKEYMHILAVVGEGHISGMSKYLSPFGLDIIHLKEVKKIAEKVMNGKLRYNGHNGGKGTNTSVNFGFTFSQ
ncbi:MAG: TraB/GumN family protein [Thermoplasmatota archaeon]